MKLIMIIMMMFETALPEHHAMIALTADVSTPAGATLAAL
jgi:hypothetical protein